LVKGCQSAQKGRLGFVLGGDKETTGRRWR
jgi:hypothetical protein